MDLREFIKETISGIAVATQELQGELEDRGVVVNPPLNPRVGGFYEHGDSSSTSRRVEIVDFDVAVTATSGAAGGGKAGVKVYSLEVSAGGNHTRTNEQVSRVRFSVPIVLSPARIEARNRNAADRDFGEVPDGRVGANSVTGY